MNRARNQLFAGSSFPQDQHCSFTGRHNLGLTQNSFQRRAVPDDFLESQLRPNFIFQIQFLLGQPVLQVGDLAVRPGIVQRNSQLSPYLAQQILIRLRKSILPRAAHLQHAQRSIGCFQRNTVQGLQPHLQRALSKPRIQIPHFF